MVLQELTRRVLVVVALALASCNDESLPEQLVMEQVIIMQEFGLVLAKVTDRASAEQHKDTVAKMVHRMNALRRELQVLPDEEKRACLELGNDLGPELQAAQAKIRSEMARIELSADIQNVLGLWLDML
jgi:phosphoenolpyruvate carboxylase